MTTRPGTTSPTRRGPPRRCQGRNALGIATAPAPAQKQLAKIADLVGRPIEIGVDTEFAGPHTLTVQAACRVENTFVIQVYRSSAIPPLPADFRLAEYMPQSTYGCFMKGLRPRPIRVIDSTLSPLTILCDLFDFREVQGLSRHEGYNLLAKRDEYNGPRNCRWDRARRRWQVPMIELVMVGHFLPADFARLFSGQFYESLFGADPSSPPLQISGAKVLSFCAAGAAGFQTPVVEYAATPNDELYRICVKTRDLMHPFGTGSLDQHSQTFLRIPKSTVLTTSDKEDMLRTFHKKTADAYGYAMVDAAHPLLVHEQMQIQHRDIYKAFACPDASIPPMKGTVGARLLDFLQTMTRLSTASGSVELARPGALKRLMAEGGIQRFDGGESRYGLQTGGVHGGLLLSRSPTQLWHESPGQFRDVDMAACYSSIISGIPTYWGRPVLHEPGSRAMSLAEAIHFVGQHAAPNGWYVRVTGSITAAPNTLIPSTIDAVTSENYQRRRRRPTALAKNSPRVGAKLFSRRIESGVVTLATWRMIQAMPLAMRAEYEALSADAIVFYPLSLVATSGAAYDKLTRSPNSESLDWYSELNMSAREQTTVESLDHRFVSLEFPIGEYARKIAKLRSEAQRASGKGSGADHAWKIQANSMYGVLASPLLTCQNVVAANQITAQARAQAFAMVHSLNGLQVITDGCTYRRDRIPECTFAECLEQMPDYPLRHADEHSRIHFLDPREVPVDDKEFTSWYRQHVRKFFDAKSREFDELFAHHALEHKRTGDTGSVAFEALACDGAGNYVKCVRGQEGRWQACEMASRGYGPDSKKILAPWIVETYADDYLSAPPPVTCDRLLLKHKKARQAARRCIRQGAPEVLLPLGYPYAQPRSYRTIKDSAFVFRDQEQMRAIVRQMRKFSEQTGCGLEILALRRKYKRRGKGSLSDLLRIIYDYIRAGGRDLNKRLNMKRARLEEVSQDRSRELKSLRKAADEDLLALIDTRHRDPIELMTGIRVTAESFALLGIAPSWGDALHPNS